MPKCFLGHLEQKKFKNVNGNFPISEPSTHPLMENSIIFFLFFGKPSLMRILASEKPETTTTIQNNLEKWRDFEI